MSDRIQQAAETCDILITSANDDLSREACRERHAVMMLAIKKGVSANWLFNGRGLFWYRDTVITDERALPRAEWADYQLVAKKQAK